MPPKLALPRGWKHRARSSVFYILPLSHINASGGITAHYTRS